MAEVEDDDSSRISELIEEGLKHVRDGGLAPSLAARELPSARAEDADVVEYVWRAGLSYMIGTALSLQRRNPEPLSVQPRSGKFRSPRHRIGTVDLHFLSSAMYVGADGIEKPLLHFTLEDVVAFGTVAGALANAWGMRERWAKVAKKRMSEQKVQDVAKLDESGLRELEGLAAAMLGGAA